MDLNLQFSRSVFPLQTVPQGRLQKLCQILWNWGICDACKDGDVCSSRKQCSWSRSRRLKSFLDFYQEATASYVPELLPGSRPALRDHDDLLNIICLLKAEPDTPRGQIKQQYFTGRDSDPKDPLPHNTDQDRSISLAVRVMTMVSCSTGSPNTNVLELGMIPMTWHNNKSLREFLAEAFPTSPSPNDTDRLAKIRSMLPNLTAKRLQRVAGLRLVPTDDLRNHLRLDQESGVVEVFHHTAFLKEYLMATRTEARTDTTILPRELAREVLDTIHRVLFPSDHESQALLRSLVSKASFDVDCLHYESASYLSEEERSGSIYVYFGSRLGDLYDEVTNPRPRSWIEKWLERKSGARYAMLATLVGVVIAIILGVLSLAVGIFQAWVAWQQWKNATS